MEMRRLIPLIATAWAMAFPLAGGAQADDVTAPLPPTIWLQEPYWHATPDFDVTWMVPAGQETPIASVHYEICFLFDGCLAREVTDWEGKGTSGIQHLVVNAEHPSANQIYGGERQVRVWLEDSAGNVNGVAKSNTVFLQYDPWTPELSAFRVSENDWLNVWESALHNVTIEYDSRYPESGIVGYSVTRDGSLPDGTLDLPTVNVSYMGRAMFLLDNLPEGLTVLKARAISGSGLRSPDQYVATGVLKVDKTAPTATVTSSSNLGAWQRDTVVLRLKGIDQPDLSGMDPAPIQGTVTDGGNLAYRADGGPLERVRGDDADVTFASDGLHTLSYQAFDAAGNRSVESTVEVKVDGTAPTALFESPSSANPLRLEVAASDRTSGVVEGKIEMRREGSDTYRALETRLDSGNLVATLDDDVPDGRYVLRARVRDRAGNETISEERVDGRRMTVTLPVRTPTRMRVARLKRPVGHGVQPAIRGRLTTAGGEPLRDAVVTVLDGGRGGKPRPVGLVRTDAEGRFSHRAPARLPSRSIRYSYAGTKTIKPVFRDVPVKVRAGVTLSTNRTWLLNGQSVVFSGRLAGPVPKGGKVVALQARKRSGWVTFGTPRANKRGVFKLRYRFTSTTGLQKYRFRVLAVRERAYPYDTGASRPVIVTVRGL
jgi:hypothetical protein